MEPELCSGLLALTKRKKTMPTTELKVTYSSDGTVTLMRECPFCGQENHVIMNAEEFKSGMKRLEAGALIQKAFPPDMFSDSLREMIMTGICDKCWKAL